MEFLVVVSGLLIAYAAGNLAVLQQDDWYAGLSRWAAARHQDAPVLAYILSLLIPAFFTGLLVWLVVTKSSWLVEFAVALFFLLYSFGRGNLEESIRHYHDHLKSGDVQAAYHDASAFAARGEELSAANWTEMHDQVAAAVSYRYFEHFFAVIFWFLLAGPVGALVYRLAELQTDSKAFSDPKTVHLGERVLRVMEWVPVRLFGMTLAIVGNFTGCIHRVVDSIVRFNQPSAAVLGDYVTGALDGEFSRARSQSHEDVSASNAVEVEEMDNLFRRALVCAVCLIALYVIFF